MLVLVATLLTLGGCTKAPASAGPPSIVLVSIDTLRADRLGVYGNPDGLTPNLDRFAEEAVVFEHAYSQATNTTLSHLSLLSSRYPSETQGGKDPRRAPIPSLAEVLHVYDYATGGFTGGGGTRAELGLDKGFDTYEDGVDFGTLWHTGPNALAWLDRRDAARPYFAFVHGYDPHTPYIKPSPYGLARIDRSHGGLGLTAVASSTERVMDGRLFADSDLLGRLFRTELRPRSPASREKLLRMARELGDEPAELTPEDLAQVRGAYDGAVAYGDAMFGLLMAGLESRGALDDAVIVVLSDHGEQLGEDGIFNHCCGAGDEEIHVPLMVRLPKGAHGGRRVPGVVELIDVMPTLLELAGASPPAGLQGASFAAALGSSEGGGEGFAGKRVAFSQAGMQLKAFAARSRTGRLAWWGIGAETPLVADVVEVARLDGPGFTRGDDTSPEEAAALRTEMVAWLKRLQWVTRGAPAPSDSLKKSLKEHGYFDMDGK